MKLTSQTHCTIDSESRELGIVLQNWAAQNGFSLDSSSPQRYVFRRGGSLGAAFSFSLESIPTTVMIGVAGDGPLEVSVSVETKSAWHVATAGDRARFDEMVNRLVAAIDSSPRKATTRRTENLPGEASSQRPANLEDLERLHSLKEKGIITDDEFQLKKKQLLGL